MKKVLIIFVFALFGSSVNAAPIITNGSLTGQITNAAPPSGWSSISGSPDTMDENNNVGCCGSWIATPSPSPDGGTWVGFAKNVGFDEVFGQTISGFDIGVSYDLSWYHANFGYASYIGANAIEVLLDGISVGSGALLSTGTAWVNEMISFTATSSSHLLSFQLLNTTQSYHSIDGIQISESNTGNVPEPTTIALLGLGLVGIGYRRKKAA